jgi:hypothetical protein
MVVSEPFSLRSSCAGGQISIAKWSIEPQENIGVTPSVELTIYGGHQSLCVCQASNSLSRETRLGRSFLKQGPTAPTV